MEQQPAAKLSQVERQAGEEDGPASATPLREPASFLPLPPELLPRVASFMHPNEVACSLRLVCKAAHVALPASKHATVRLSEPSPPAEFERRWCSRPDALRTLNHWHREQVVLLTARSGSVGNLSALAARGDMPLLSQGPFSTYLLQHAAHACRLDLCRWMHGRGVALEFGHLRAAASEGHMDVCEWLLDSGCVWNKTALGDAARGGHVQLFERLMQRTGDQPASSDIAVDLLAAGAQGFELPALQRLYEQHVQGLQPCWTNGYGAKCTLLAVGSPTPDWAAKLDWLEGLGCPSHPNVLVAAAQRPDAVARLQCLQGRGHDLNSPTFLVHTTLHRLGCGRWAVIAAAVEMGNEEAVKYLLAQRKDLSTADATQLLSTSAARGDVAVAQVLHAAGGDVTPGAVASAAANGYLPLVEWAAEQMGDAFPLDAGVFAAAAKSGSLPLMRWLHERGCEWDEDAFAAAASTCSEEALEWLAERGCPMGDDGAPYVEAVEHRDLLILRCLRRLGCPFDAGGGTFTACAEYVAGERAWTGDMYEGPLAWLLDAGCPVDWPAAVRAARGHAALDAWLQEQRRLRAKPQRKGRARQR